MDNSDIQRIEREYWGRFEPSQLNDAMRYYVCKDHRRLDGKSLLDAELECAWAADKIKAQPCETLVLLVGFSLEPLLQSVCVYQPQKVVLVLNEKGYPGETPETWQTFAGYVTEAIGCLVKKGLLSQLPQFPGKNGEQGYPAADQPAAVFQMLVKALHDETDAVIDVTGGKKSMVSGAYLYAAYAGTRISYVDFDEYDPKHRRPYGYSCKIGELANPYQKFALREWERVRALYERYQFREARLLIGQDGKCKPGTVMVTMMKYLPDSQQAIEVLVEILSCYEKWDAGLYNEAAESARSIKGNISQFEPPTAVSRLDGKWFSTRQARFERGLPDFYEDTLGFRAYVCDELARIQRLINYNEDYRSAFLRAGSLNEIVMLARLVKLVEDVSQRKDLVEALQSKTPGAESVFEHLKKSSGKTFQIGLEKEGNDICFSGAPTIIVTIKEEMIWWRGLSLFDGQGSWKQFIHLRNDLAHKYYSPPRQWAEDVLAFVKANVIDFLGQQRINEVQTAALTWPDLCDLCGISRFLPPNLRKEGQS